MTLAAGSKLGPYEIIASLGEGGMGVGLSGRGGAAQRGQRLDKRYIRHRPRQGGPPNGSVSNPR